MPSCILKSMSIVPEIRAEACCLRQTLDRTDFFLACFFLLPSLRPAGGDPGVYRPQKYFIDGLCSLGELGSSAPIKAFHEEAVWFMQRKTRRKVAPFLMPLGAARAARSADWLKIDMRENQSFDFDGQADRDSWSIRYGVLCHSPLICTSTHVRVSLVSPLHAYRWACYWKQSTVKLGLYVPGLVHTFGYYVPLRRSRTSPIGLLCPFFVLDKTYFV